MYRMLFADEKGRLYDHPEMLALGRSGNIFMEPDFAEDYIPMPQGASLTLVPQTRPIGIEEDNFALLTKLPWGEGKALAVGALLPQGYTRTLLPAYQKETGTKPLPLFGYSAVAWKDGEIFVAAMKTDEDKKWNPDYYNSQDLAALVQKKVQVFPMNRIISQLAKCALEYSCFTAQNIFYGRWEGGLPSAPVCNAHCLGCISLQPAECCPSPQERIDFQPTLDELMEVALSHLEASEEAIISFGQGCEGEPALQGEILGQLVRQLRAQTSKGTINMNTNAGFTLGVKAVCQAGLDSIRVSLISARPGVYEAYYRPNGYALENVIESLKAAKQFGVYTSLNLLVMPGLTDREEELEALITLINDCRVDLLQLRNLNIDPDFLFKILPTAQGENTGIKWFVQQLQECCPDLVIGNYSRSLR